jgi:hypothetical protein
MQKLFVRKRFEPDEFARVLRPMPLHVAALKSPTKMPEGSVYAFSAGERRSGSRRPHLSRYPCLLTDPVVTAQAAYR